DRLVWNIGVSRCIKQDGPVGGNGYASDSRTVRGRRRRRLMPQLEQAVDQKRDAEDTEKTADCEAFIGAAAETDQHHQADADANERDAGTPVPPGAGRPLDAI